MTLNEGPNGKEEAGGNETRETEPEATPETVPFDQFSAFVKKVISVPKSEIDRREREYQEERRERDRLRKVTGPD